MLTRLTGRDRIALVAGGVAVALFLVVKFGVLPLLDRGGGGSIEDRELTLRRSERLVAGSATELASLGAAEQRLKGLETGLLESPSPSLANAEWQRLVREVADSKGLELGSTEFLRVQPLAPDYTLVVGRVTLRCRLDQLVDLVTAFGAAPKLLSVMRLRAAPIQGDAGKRLNTELIVGAAMRGGKAAKGTAQDQP